MGPTCQSQGVGRTVFLPEAEGRPCSCAVSSTRGTHGSWPTALRSASKPAASNLPSRSPLLQTHTRLSCLSLSLKRTLVITQIVQGNAPFSRPLITPAKDLMPYRVTYSSFLGIRIGICVRPPLPVSFGTLKARPVLTLLVPAPPAPESRAGPASNDWLAGQALTGRGDEKLLFPTDSPRTAMAAGPQRAHLPSAPSWSTLMSLLSTATLYLHCFDCTRTLPALSRGKGGETQSQAEVFLLPLFPQRPLWQRQVGPSGTGLF